MDYAISMLEGYVTPTGSTRRTKRSITMKLGTAARKCKGKKKGAFRACIRKQMRKGHTKRHSRRRRRR